MTPPTITPPALSPEERQAQQLLFELQAEGGELTFQEPINNWYIGCSEHWSEEQGHSWGKRIVALDAPLRRLLGKDVAA